MWKDLLGNSVCSNHDVFYVIFYSDDTVYLCLVQNNYTIRSL